MQTLFLAVLALSASSLDAGAAPPGDSARWDSLTSSPVPVECVEVGGTPWCRSFGVINAPISQVASALENMRNNAALFESVISINVVAEDTLHIVLDYPSPLDDRDYVAKYTHTTEGDAHVFSWTPAAGVPEDTSVAVRLPNFEGEWRLEPRGNQTWVRYTWQAEINGSFPSFGYSTAWKRAGHEALKDLANTQRASLSAP